MSNGGNGTYLPSNLGISAACGLCNTTWESSDWFTICRLLAISRLHKTHYTIYNCVNTYTITDCVKYTVDSLYMSLCTCSESLP